MYVRGFPNSYYRLAMFGFFAAAVSFGLETGVVIGAFFSVSGSVMACSACGLSIVSTVLARPCIAPGNGGAASGPI